MNTHIKLLGLFYLIWGAMGVVGMIAVLLIGGLTGFFASLEEPKAGIVLGLVMLAVIVISAISTIPDLICGWGLVRYRPWARIFTIILSILHLFAFPLGTALGIYGLWVMFQPEAIQVLASGRSRQMPPEFRPADQ